ncbi:hypothetical protein H0G86_002494 [Trichoderma simmonsii]|uniref:Uncharacterized protein n=1 Tax=Trichoderma simmonsii TaxID=1491479 RepID=A0A8G0L8P0_9HYPO|nr:hypothetical protein H0G86_002494 [Trichoderma simmonsii]
MEHRTSPEPGAFVQLAVERSGGRRRSHTSNLGDSQNPAITPTPSVALLAPTTRPPRPLSSGLLWLMQMQPLQPY